uniref:Metalloendopeptidase n=1 Tax=Meloidogyne javanica TaxID=6303 RepID=A0A915MNX0_MELJA
MTSEEKEWVYRSEIRWAAERNKIVDSSFRSKRNGVSRSQKLWPNGRIPYMISSQYTPHERALLAKAVKQYHDRSCVRFVARTPADGDYLFVGKVDGCFSEVGKTSVTVFSCMDYSTIIHEIMHVVGFYHEHDYDLAKINKMYNCQQQSQPQNTQQQKTSLIAQHAATKSKTQILPPFSLLIASEGNGKKGGVGNVGVLTKVDEKGKGKPQGINRNFQGK